MNTILGITPATGDGLPAKAPRGRDAERILAGELLQEFRHFSGTMTEFAERYAGRIYNHVLLTETQTFPASGIIDRQFHVAAGAIEVSNLATAVAASSTSTPTLRTVTAPGAGNEWSVTVPAGETWTTQSVAMVLTTSAVVANRRVLLTIDDGAGNIILKVVTGFAQTATSAIEYYYSACALDTSSARTNTIQESMPALVLPAGYRIRTITSGIDVGDAYTAIVLTYAKATTVAAAAHSMTVHAAGPASSAPGAGVGMYVVPAGVTRVIPLASRQVTLYGTQGDQVSFAVYTAAPRPAAV